MKKQDDRGFTLIEILIAIFILSVVLLSLSSMVYSIMRSTSLSKETSRATTLMQDQMERLKNTPLTSLNSGSDPPTSLGNITYSRTWSVTTAGNIRTITVTVNWTDRGSHSVTMTTLRGD
jgi:prepilin-type N-terminal cleavage/methylation domain-containing protein